MSKFTSEKLAEFYKRVGLSKAEFFDGKKPVNLFKILKINPKTDANGNRIKTPYEMLGVFPCFVNGVERPIVFAIKNRVLGIGKYEGEIKDFVYKKQKVKEEKTIIQTLKEKYRAAIFAGDESAAESCLEMISNLSAEEAREFRDTFYNYTKFYKRMKKQLLLDLFAHFFLELVQARSTIVKNGLIRKDRLYKAYREKNQNYSQDVTFDSELDIISVSGQVNPINFGMQNIKKVVVENKETDMVSEFEVSKDEIKVKTNLEMNLPQVDEQQVQVKANLEMLAKPQRESVHESKAQEIDEFDMGFFGTIKSFISKKRKPLRRVGAIPNNMQNEDEEEYTSFSKVEKSQREREIEI